MKRSQYYGVCKDLGQRVYMAAWGKGDTDPVAARLYAARMSVALSIPQMAKLLGVNRSSVWRWEHGVIESMSMYHIMKWSDITGCSWRWLIHGGDVQDRARYNYFVMLKSVALAGKLKPLPDELGVVASWAQRAKERERIEAEKREDEEDRIADAWARRRGNL